MWLKRAKYRGEASVQFWDNYARWYKLWMEHNNYHAKTIKILNTMVKSRWRVLDIGAGSGVLSLPLCTIGCDVTALEPSTGMRILLQEQTLKSDIGWIRVDKRRWEDTSCIEFQNYNLIIACNTLHLTKSGFFTALKKIFMTNPEHVCLITECDCPEIIVKYHPGKYRMIFAKFHETESSFAYHSMNEVWEHWSFKKGRALYPEEKNSIIASIVYENGHFLIKDTAYVGMYWWSKTI